MRQLTTEEIERLRARRAELAAIYPVEEERVVAATARFQEALIGDDDATLDVAARELKAALSDRDWASRCLGIVDLLASGV